MNMEYSENEVKWIYNNTKYKYEVSEIEFASDMSQCIYIEMIQDGIYEYRLVDFEGKDICSYNENSRLKIYDMDGCSHESNLEDINDILFLEDRVLVMNKKEEILLYGRNGICNGIIKPPFGFIFSRFCNAKKLEAVCQGSIQQADNYGRVDYRFEYDFLTNSWNKKSLAY